MRRSSTRRIALVLGALAAPVALAVGLPLILNATPRPLHLEPGRAPSAAQSEPSPQWRAQVARGREVMRTALVEENLPGLSVAVGAGGELVWAEGFGFANVEQRAPVTPDTRFRIGAASTVLTSAAVDALVEQGRLNLDEEIQTYVPRFPRKKSPVTLRQLMEHRAGLTTDSPDNRPLARVRCERPAEAVEHFAGDDLLFGPGTESRYSKYGWVLVSAAVEAAAGQPFLTVMREQVFQPRGMDDTGAESANEENPEGIGEPGEDAPPITVVRELILEPLGIVRPDVRPTRIATAYFRGFGRYFRYGLHDTSPGNLSCYAGAMAFLSTPSDLVRLGEPTPAAAPDAVHRGVASVTVIRAGGLVVAVASNIATADTATLARRVADSF